MLARGHRKETEKPPKLVCSGGRRPGDGKETEGREKREIGSASHWVDGPPSPPAAPIVGAGGCSGEGKGGRQMPAASRRSDR
ncbi:hypothetical protein CCMA1212_008723 [Trichoderma ghanense]|uniref:Uncharacterized protein n=1 Tax=Trichoderma ghanense TaxID=65468 RepID=A0ABY2GW59_9HYPO